MNDPPGGRNSRRVNYVSTNRNNNDEARTIHIYYMFSPSGRQSAKFAETRKEGFFVPTYNNQNEIHERNACAHAYSTKCCRRRARAIRRRNERRERTQRGLSIAAVILCAVLCGVVLGGVV